MAKHRMKNLLRKYFKPYYHFVLKFTHIFIFWWNHVPLHRSWKLKQKLEIGSGSIRRDGWISSDYRPGCDLMLDITRKWPFSNGGIDELYCCHVLEHFDHKELKFILSEAYRVLSPGGRFRISVPDLDIFLKAYTEKDTSILKFKPAIISDCPSDILNYIFYMDGEHKNMFDFSNMHFHLTTAGFNRIEKRAYDPDLDGTGRDDESLFVVCFK